MTKYVSEMSAAKSISAYVIMKGAREVATVQVFHGNSCLVNVFQNPDAYHASYKRVNKIKGALDRDQESAACDAFGFQYGRAGGYGYDKETAALSGLWIDGHELTDHCSRIGAPKPPKDNCGLYPRDFKAPKGFSLANFTRISRATGKRMDALAWRLRAETELGTAEAPFEDIREKAFHLERAWCASDDCIEGYFSCHRESGFAYLRAHGYRIIRAI